MTRDEILQRFEAMLDEALASEEPPSGLDAELLALASPDSESDRQCDSYALWAALTALTQETKLQGRAFRELNEAIASQPQGIAAEIRADFEARERELQRQAERRVRREVVGALIDLRDRLVRGLESAETSASPPAPEQRRWLDRLTGRKPPSTVSDTVIALLKGYRLGLERLDSLLEEFNAREIHCLGQAFDPRRMNAVDMEESDSAPEGTVLEVYRSGYEWSGEVLRPAQVKVARAAGRLEAI
jgi:molecular chaperone GrpE (heat shock protein)